MVLPSGQQFLSTHGSLLHGATILRSLPMPTAISDTGSSHNVSASGGVSPLTGASAATTANHPTTIVSSKHWERNMAAANHEFTKSQMNDIVLDYLVKEGFREAAEAFAAEAGIILSPDKLKGMDERLAIRTSITAGDVLGAIKKINDINCDLLDENVDINFQLKQQHVIEMIRRGDKEGALKFAQLYLSEHGDDSGRRQSTEKTLMLLCFDDGFDSCPVKDLLSESKRIKLSEDVNSAILLAQDREPTSKLAKAVQILDWAQTSLDEKAVKYPRMDDITTGELNFSGTPLMAAMQ